MPTAQTAPSGHRAILAAVGTVRPHLVGLEHPADTPDATSGTLHPSVPFDLHPAGRPGWPTLAALAAGCGLLAVVLGAWALVSSIRAEEATPPSPALERAIDVLGAPGTERYPLRGSVGRITLVVAADDRGVLVLDGLGHAPDRRVYVAWVVPPGSATPRPAATFSAAERAVPLDLPVVRGARVAVTLETAPAPDRPSRPLRLVAVRPAT